MTDADVCDRRTGYGRCGLDPGHPEPFHATCVAVNPTVWFVWESGGRAVGLGYRQFDGHDRVPESMCEKT